MNDKKKDIVLSAINVFQEKGFENATVSAIVKGAGIAQGTFYLYFPSKLSVIPGIVEVIIEKITNTVTQNINFSTSFKYQLRQIIDIVFDYTGKYREILALIYVRAGSNRQLHEWEEMYEPYYKIIGEVLKEAQQKNEIRQLLNPKQTAAILIGLIESAAKQSYFYNSTNDKVAILKKEEVLDFAMRALIPDM